MPVNFYKFLKTNNTLADMPAIKIKSRKTDKFITYNKNLMRLDFIAGEVYEDETLSKVIMWANPEYFLEFDIPDNTIIRIPFPINEVISEINAFITNNKDK